MSEPLVVLKFGGSVLAGEASLTRVTHEMYSWVQRGCKVIAVVSAFEGVTDTLVRQAKRYGERPHEAARALLTATGELTSASLLCLSLDRAGLTATVAPPWSIGLKADGSAIDAFPRDVSKAVVREALSRYDILIVPGFFGISERGDVVLLGRGGSDLSALFLAHRLGAQTCRLVKDVDGLYEFDPASAQWHGETPRRYASITWDDALALDGGVVQHKAIRYARDVGLRFEVGTLHQTDPTIVGAPASTLRTVPDAPRQRLRIALLGAGTVGFGVYQLAQDDRERFEVVSVSVRDVERAVARGVPRDLLSTDPVACVGSPCDVVVETLGGLTPATDAITLALRSGRRVVTANKAVVAAAGQLPLWRDAAANGRLRHSAAVGGAAPLLEAVRRIAESSNDPIVRMVGVINGTCNAVLDHVKEEASIRGVPEAFAQGVRAAQDAGLAEADPSRDLDGRDAADKACLLAAQAWGTGGTLRPEDVLRTALTPEVVEAIGGPEGERVVRQVACIERSSLGEITASVEPAALDDSHPLRDIACDGNALVITTRLGHTHVVRGRGAGRWPTAESVFADLLQMYYEHAASAVDSRFEKRDERAESENGTGQIRTADLTLIRGAL